MIRAYVAYICSWSYLFLSLPLLFRVMYLNKKEKIKESNRLTYQFTRSFARLIIRLTGSTVHVIGNENIPKNEPILFVSNHPSHLDSAIIQGYISQPKGFVATAKAKQFPILRTWMKYMNCIFIEKENIRQSLKCINQGIDLLKNGHSVVIFPEGNLSDRNLVGEFKPGSLKLALKSGVPIVPITIRGTDDIMEKNILKVKPAFVECIISKPIFLDQLTREEEKELPTKIRNIIADNFNGIQKKIAN